MSGSIYKIELLSSDETVQKYLINESITITLDDSKKDDFLTADYNEELLTESEVNEIIDEFVKTLGKAVNNLIKRKG